LLVLREKLFLAFSVVRDDVVPGIRGLRKPL
jgi:hypothetical protein